MHKILDRNRVKLYNIANGSFTCFCIKQVGLLLSSSEKVGNAYEQKIQIIDCAGCG